jgi:hypothetical protein
MVTLTVPLSETVVEEVDENSEHCPEKYVARARARTRACPHTQTHTCTYMKSMSKNCVERDQLGDLDIDGRISVKLVCGDWIHLAWEGVQWQAGSCEHRNEPWVPQMVINFLINSATISFSRRTLLHGVALSHF